MIERITRETKISVAAHQAFFASLLKNGLENGTLPPVAVVSYRSCRNLGFSEEFAAMFAICSTSGPLPFKNQGRSPARRKPAPAPASKRGAFSALASSCRRGLTAIAGAEVRAVRAIAASNRRAVRAMQSKEFIVGAGIVILCLGGAYLIYRSAQSGGGGVEGARSVVNGLVESMPDAGRDPMEAFGNIDWEPYLKDIPGGAENAVDWIGMLSRLKSLNPSGCADDVVSEMMGNLVDEDTAVQWAEILEANGVFG